jgi:hypothetical protein
VSSLAQASASIDAPISVVWDVMVDVDAYGEWNPFIVDVDGPSGRPPAVEDDLVLHVRWSDGKGVKTRERITRMEPPVAHGEVQRAVLEYEFRGPIAALHLSRGRRVQVLEQRAGEPAVYVTSERLHGLFVRLAPMDKVRDGFERHAAALKARAEARPTRPASDQSR